VGRTRCFRARYGPGTNYEALALRNNSNHAASQEEQRNPEEGRRAPRKKKQRVPGAGVFLAERHEGPTNTSLYFTETPSREGFVQAA